MRSNLGLSASLEVQVRKFRSSGSWKFLGNSGWEKCLFKMGSSELGKFNVSNLGWELRVIGNWGGSSVLKVQALDFFQGWKFMVILKPQNPKLQSPKNPKPKHFRGNQASSAIFRRFPCVFHVMDTTKRRIFDRGHAFANTRPVQVSGFKRLNFKQSSVQGLGSLWIGARSWVEFMGFFEGAL